MHAGLSLQPLSAFVNVGARYAGEMDPLLFQAVFADPRDDTFDLAAANAQGFLHAIQIERPRFEPDRHEIALVPGTIGVFNRLQARKNDQDNTGRDDRAK